MRQTLINKLQAFFPAYPVEKAWMFGSYARGDETRKSDVDILVRFDENATITLIDYAKIMNNLSDLLHKKVDLVKEGTLRKFAVESVEQDKLLSYERPNER
jgi:predicted nucleotidyltransferase